MVNLSDYQFIDIHYHASPDLYIRRLDALEAGREYHAHHGAVVLKSHLGATSVQATLAQRLGLPVFPSLVLNAIAGGIHYRVIEKALLEYQSESVGKMIVHFPTITGRKYHSKLSRQLVNNAIPLLSETLFNESQTLKKEVLDILRMARDYPIVLSTGHASKEEVYALIDACVQFSVPQLLLNQPANPLTGLDAAALKEVSKLGFIFTEQTALTYLLGHQSKEDFTEVLCTIPGVIYSSDLGQTSQMGIRDWLDFSNRMFDDLGLTESRKNEIWRQNAFKLLANKVQKNTVLQVNL